MEADKSKASYGVGMSIAESLSQQDLSTLDLDQVLAGMRAIFSGEPPLINPEEANMQLVALPYAPNNAEYLALINSRRILGDQMEFLRGQFSKNSRFL